MPHLLLNDGKVPRRLRDHEFLMREERPDRSCLLTWRI